MIIIKSFLKFFLKNVNNNINLNKKELEDHLEALIKINNPANLNALDLIILQVILEEIISIMKKQ